jgi:hypothetical protein
MTIILATIRFKLDIKKNKFFNLKLLLLDILVYECIGNRGSCANNDFENSKSQAKHK